MTKAKLDLWTKDWQAKNKWLKQNHMPTISLEEHIQAIHGKKYKPTFKPLVPTERFHRTTRHIPSASVMTGSSSSTAKKDRPQYTGSYVIGIATMHKSNAVPVTNPEQAEEIARMAK